MTIHVHRLGGCAPTPLAWYLKALGVLRLVSEQVDPSVRGFWQDEAFHLATCLSREDLEEFFLSDYSPTPLVAPWNGGSGFYPKDNRKALTLLASTTDVRFAAYREALLHAQSLVVGRTERPDGEGKTALIARCRAIWRGRLLEWFECALVLGAGNPPKPEYPALLGTGGNDGRMDFTNNFMQRHATLLVAGHRKYVGAPVAALFLRSTLWDCAVPGIPQDSVGQFLPGGAGGANGTTGPDASAQVNPWDFVLMLEGSILFAASVVRRSATEAPTSAAAPFAIRPSAVGYASASKAEEDSRGEQWMPLWSSPASLTELRRLLSEGRSQLGASPAGRPVDFARAVARLGIARGITAFQRFGYIKRNGKSNLAIPLGRWLVAEQPRQELIDDLDPWLRRLRRVVREKDAPQSLVAAFGRLEDSLLAIPANSREARRWQALLLALADVERRLVASPRFTAVKHLQPIPSLRTSWFAAADDGSVELRLALALASQSADGRGENPVRAHWLPLDDRGRFAVDTGSIRKDPRVVCQGAEPWRDCIALVRRRLVEGGAGAESRLALNAPPRRSARVADVEALIAGDVDIALVCDLARPLMALRPGPVDVTPTPTHAASIASDLYALFRLACLPWALPDQPAVPADPAIVARLASGDLAAAGDLAIRRLSAKGLRPRLRRVAGDSTLAMRLAASLAFPISKHAAARLARRLIHEETADAS